MGNSQTLRYPQYPSIGHHNLAVEVPKHIEGYPTVLDVSIACSLQAL
jgi:hypothetical protein